MFAGRLVLPLYVGQNQMNLDTSLI
jgi:hypothetical protein